MSSSLLTCHFQMGLPPWARRFFETSGAGWAKLMDPGEAPPLPDLDVNWILRFYEDEATARTEVMKGKAGALERYGRIKPLLDARPWLSGQRYYVESMNEPSNAGILRTRDGREALDAHEAEFAKIMWERRGIRVVIMCLGVGHPEPEHLEQLFSESMPAAKRYHGLWSAHGYGYPGVMDAFKWHAGRAVMVMDGLDALGIEYPPLAMTEAGIDKLLVGERGGWKTVNNDPRWYVHTQLAPLDDAMIADGRTVCITVFTASAQQKWKTYEVDEPCADVMAAYVRDKQPAPAPQTVKSFFLSGWQDGLTLDDLKAAKRAGYLVAHVKASEGANVDPGFARWWDMAGRAGLKRTAFHYLTQNDGGQAATFRRAVGNRDPVAIFGDFEAHDLTLEKCHDFLKHADMRFADWRARRGRLCDIYTGAWWLDPRGKPTWETEGRKLWVSDCSGGEKPRLPKAFSTWEWWQHVCGRQIEPFAPTPVCVDRYNGTVADLERDYPGAIPEPPPGNGGEMKIYDWEGRERDWAWLRGKYGDVQVLVPEGGTTWSVCEFREDLSGSNTLLVEVRGAPPGTLVTFAWPDGSAQAPTKETGRAEFPMGGGAYYQPPGGGPHRVWVSGGGSSEVVDGLGMLFGSNHHHLNVAFRKGAAPPAEKHELHMRVEGIGAIGATPDKAEYGHGETVVLEAQETDSEWRFSRWEGDLSGTANPQTLTMDADKNVTAVFAEEGGGPDVESAIAEARKIIDHATEAIRLLGAMP